MKRLLASLLLVLALLSGSAFSTTITDDFNRANGVLGANYTRGLGTANTIQVVSNAAQVGVSSSDFYALYTGTSFGSDQEAAITIVSDFFPTDDYVQLAARASGADSTFAGYAVYTNLTSGAGNTEIARYSAGSSTTLKSATVTFSSGDQIGIRVTGSNPVVISLLKNGSVVDSYSDSSGSRISSGGTIGFGAYEYGGNTSVLDDFTGGDYGSSPATLSSPTPSGTLGTQNTATIGATTNQTSGTFYAVVDTAGNISGITASQVKAGQNNASAAAVDDCSASVSTSTPSCGVSGLTDSTAYSYAAVQNNANGDSNVVTGTFTTAASGGGGSAVVPVFFYHYRTMKQ